MPNLGGAFALPDLQSAFGEFQACVGEVALPRGELGHVDLPVCASITTALPLVDLDCQPLATHAEQEEMFELPCIDQAETPRRSLRCQSMETACTCLLEATFQNSPNQKRGQTRQRKARSPAARPSYLRCEAENDLGQISSKYGADLIQVPAEWLDLQKAVSLLTSLNILVWTVSGAGQVLKFDSPLFLLEIFAVCWRLTREAIEVGYSCVPSIDILPAFGGGRVFDILTSAGRQVVWALIVVLKNRCGSIVDILAPSGLHLLTAREHAVR